ncbi:putative quinol monooxygenase [Streptomyces yangpuensis]|uniref:putative quinol monooxygenase n=1 Tax=Streptomyces yangpuensis TaxID=1648182 RepID=UPI0006298C9C|nr:antibiotic biosynthesis monooxygenase [Streptomyces yangpuensis]
MTSAFVPETTRVGLLARIEAKPEHAADVEGLLTGALTLAEAETGTTVWFALKLGPTTFGIFDAFGNDADRTAHLQGKIAAALMESAPTLLAAAPEILPIDVLAAKF